MRPLPAALNKFQDITSIAPELRCIGQMALALSSYDVLSLLLPLQYGHIPDPKCAIANTAYVAGSVDEPQAVRALFSKSGKYSKRRLHSSAICFLPPSRVGMDGRWHLHSELQIQPSTDDEKYSVRGNRAEQSLLVEARSAV